MDWKKLREMVLETVQEGAVPVFLLGVTFLLAGFVGNTPWYWIPTGVVLIAGGAAAAISGGRRTKAAQPTLLERVEQSFAALREAASVVSEVEDEITASAARMRDVQRQLEHNQRLAQLSEAETRAVRAVLDAQFRRERRPTMVQNAIFMLLGLGLGEIVDRVVGG